MAAHMRDISLPSLEDCRHCFKSRKNIQCKFVNIITCMFVIFKADSRAKKRPLKDKKLFHLPFKRTLD